MRITILCGKLEPGRDGVGDYSRQLAKEAIRQGHKVQLISLQDKTSNSAESSEPNILRCNGALNDSNYSKEIQTHIKNWAPEVISLQFVPFSFHPKGLIDDLTPFITELRSQYRLHLMFHETWVRWEYGTKFRHRILGQVQRPKILNAVRIWQPECVHTSNAYYAEILQRNGIACTELALFGNIPIRSECDENKFYELLDGPIEASERRIIFPFNQDPKWQPLRLLKRIKGIAESSASKVPIRLIQIGRTHAELDHWNHIQQFAQAAGWKCDRLGAQDTEILSLAFQSCHLGVASAPIQLAGKSGAVAAMIEHGLPVLCSSHSGLRNWPCYSKARLAAAEIDKQTLAKLLLETNKQPPSSHLPKTCQQWLQAIQ